MFVCNFSRILNLHISKGLKCMSATVNVVSLDDDDDEPGSLRKKMIFWSESEGSHQSIVWCHRKIEAFKNWQYAQRIIPLRMGGGEFFQNTICWLLTWEQSCVCTQRLPGMLWHFPRAHPRFFLSAGSTGRQRRWNSQHPQSRTEFWNFR